MYRNPKRNPTPIKIGMKARFNERDYTVTARLTKGMTEEGVIYYWDEYQLVDTQGAELWLEFEENSWKTSQSFTPTKPIGPQQAPLLQLGSKLDLEGKFALVTQKERAQLYHVEGQPTWNAVPGDSRFYIDAGFGSNLYSVEWNAREIEFFRGKNLTAREVYEAFGLKEELIELDKHQRKRTSQNVFATVCLALGLFALLIWSISGGSGRTVQQGRAPLTSINGEQGVRFGPFDLNPGRKVHRFVVWANMTQASAWVSGVIEGAAGEEMMNAQNEMWDESGRDSEGSWHETDLRTSMNFIVTQSGPYYVRLYAEPETTYAGSFGDAGFEIHEGVTHGSWLGWFALCSLPLAIAFYMMGSRERLAKIEWD